ncbi:zinc transporter [Acetobacterium tundrae]|uniref:Zinc transporter n=1 Tax=Acetobacterium tundrae TaxID=132932 RepID=A0ABR6WHX6_9FIRM|nr:zinc transporter [Acetobacterium tundrae]MBC3795747.1 zinc transporter [Acetobacterium tundrae]
MSEDKKLHSHGEHHDHTEGHPHEGCIEHEHGSEEGHEHSHEHGHTHPHSDDHGHEHTPGEEHEHEHTHEHTHPHEHPHTHGDEHGHSHEGNSAVEDKDLEIISILLDHWVSHNQDHAAEYKTWVEKMNKLGKNEVAKALTEAIELMAEADKHLIKAKKYLI